MNERSAVSDPVRKTRDDSLTDLNNLLISYLHKEDLQNSRKVAGDIMAVLAKSNNVENESVLTAYYLTGVYFLTTKDLRAASYLEQALASKEKLQQFDELYSRILYNLSVAYFNSGDPITQKNYALRALEIEKKIYGDNSSELLQTYGNLINACTGLQEYQEAIDYGLSAIAIAGPNSGPGVMKDILLVYNGMAITYIHTADYSKARVYLENQEALYERYHFRLDENYSVLLSNLAIVYGYLKLTEKSYQYYEKGIKLATSLNSPVAYNLMNNYALALSTSGIRANTEKGEDIHRKALNMCRNNLPKDSLTYISVLFDYAEYLRDEMGKPDKAINYYRQCISYLQRNELNISHKDPVYLGYALSLAETGDTGQALEIIQSLLFQQSGNGAGNSIIHSFKNPASESVKPDKLSLKILGSKYLVLWKIYSATHDLEVLKAAAETSKLIVGVIEKVRVNISEEDSRLLLGDRYRNSYINSIRDFNLLYTLTGDTAFINDAYTYAEKSKVAGLLTAAREVNASHFNIPADLADLETRIRSNIIYLNAGMEDELGKTTPDLTIVNDMKHKILRSSMLRDSLVSVFEKKYPGYYSFKYNSSVVGLKDIPDLIGKDVNYINFIASDSIMFIFIANSKSSHLLSIPTDSSFYSDIRHFRKLLGMPSPSGNARLEFGDYQSVGYRIYRKIIEPVRPYLISDKLLISPDNSLSYIPFETLPASLSESRNLNYNQIHYLMNDFDISYTYSVTFMAESMKRKRNFNNRLIAFAPEYNEPVDIGTVMQSRQMVAGVLPDLPFARQEAEYVTELTQGKLYENNDAREMIFKAESGQYDIIHLAMHTILNDRKPMYSTLIFSPGKDSTEDRYLKTYEIYSIPLKAKMVVLSSCNSGAGFMYSGEGVLSLARGFMYSGSESVVMALWEIEDRSGTEIVKGFYDNLKKGYSKSSALRRARIKYLEGADQLRSHPYFWSTLVIYGDNESLYISKYFLLLPVAAVMIISLLTWVYFRRRRYS